MEKTLQPSAAMLKEFYKQHHKFTDMDRLRGKEGAPTNTHNVLKQTLRRNQFFNQPKNAKERLDES